jgi:hypothetical protein
VGQEAFQDSGPDHQPRATTRAALERALNESAPAEFVLAVEESAEIRGVGRMVDFDPHSEGDFPREPGM